ncbi:MAG: hypothetical protein KG003_13990 [Bacteroidetes bacterium]|nr:hypothetical protein [Bacteroidota bacterium]
MIRTLPAPEKKDGIPSHSQWLAGEGAGSWFHIEKLNELFKITRYSPGGNVECSGLFFHPSEFNFHANDTFRMIYPCHCKIVNVLQADIIFTFYLIRLV